MQLVKFVVVLFYDLPVQLDILIADVLNLLRMASVLLVSHVDVLQGEVTQFEGMAVVHVEETAHLDALQGADSDVVDRGHGWYTACSTCA